MKPNRTISNVVGWGVGLAIFQKLGGVLLTLVLVRLISAEAYGQFGLVNAMLMFTFAFSLQRYMEHSFHQAGDAERSYSQHLGFGVLLHLGIFVVLNMLLIILPLPVNYNAIREFAHIGSLAILLNVPRIYYSTHLRRVLDWRRIRTLHLLSFLLAAISSIALALAGFGVFALLVQGLVVPLPYIIDLCLNRRDLLRIKMCFTGYRQALRFGFLRTGSSTLGVGQKLVEASIFTAVAGFASFGVYGRAAGIATLTTAWLADQIHSIVYPVLARISPRGAQAKLASGLVLRLALWTSAPLGIALYVFNDVSVNLLYGPDWAQVAPLLRPALVIAILATTTRGLNLVALTMLGAGAALGVDLALLLVSIAGLLLALDHGALAYAWFLVAGNGAVLGVLTAMLVRYQALALQDLFCAAAPILILALLAGWAMTNPQIITWDSDHSVPVLIIAVIMSGLLALALARLLDPSGLATACRYIPGGARLAHLVGLTLRTA